MATLGHQNYTKLSIKKYTKLNDEIFYTKFLIKKGYTIFRKNYTKIKCFTPSNKTFTPDLFFSANQKNFTRNIKIFTSN